MQRSVTHRILGGVCGGLAARIPLSPPIWRLLFLLLTLWNVTAGTAIYLLLWWLLPPASLLHRRRNAPLNTLLALIFTAFILFGAFSPGIFQTASGRDMYLPVIALLVALVFLFRQIQSGATSNILTGIVMAAIPAVFIAGTLEILPFGIFDVILRGLPALLIFAGLTLLLRNRIPYGGIIALVVSVGLAGGIAGYAFSSRVDNVLTQNQITVTETISDSVTTIQINVEALTTEVQFFSAAPGSRDIRVSYSGSSANDLPYTYEESGGGLATFTVRERKQNPYPLLEEIGRGTMQIELPQDIAMSVAFAGMEGNATFDMGNLDLERLNLDIHSGDALVTLPAYQPLSPGVAQNPGEFFVRAGNLRILIPDAAAGRFVLDKSLNQFPNRDEALYAVEDTGTQWILVSRRYDTSAIQVQYRLTVPRGEIQLQVEDSSSE